MIVIGLTGSVGMGKSTTAGLFREADVPVFDADAAVHRLYAGQAVLPVEAAFPGVARDGAIDRVALGQRVIGDADAMARLEAIVHPLVRAARSEFLATARNEDHPVAVLDVPLLLERGGVQEVDVVVVASAPFAVQKARVMARPGMTEARFDAIVATQMADVDKRRLADFIVETDEGLDAARDQVRAILEAIRTQTRA